MELQTVFSRIKELVARKGSYFFVFGAAVILLFIIFSIVLISSKNTKKTTIVVPTPAPSSFYQQPAASPTLATNTTLSPEQQTILENQTIPQIQKTTPVNFSVTKVHPYAQDWAIMVVSTTDAGDAYVIVQKENGAWKVVLGPGTYFDPQQLQSVGAPQSLIDNVNAKQ